MKKIIEGKKYDTETAKCIGEWWNNNDVRNFSHVEETLYQKRTGEFFIFGVGGPSSKYARSEGQNSWTGGEKIIPVSYPRAKAWAEEKLTVEEFERAFGEVSEGEDDTIVVKVPAAIGAKVRSYAAEHDMSLKDVVIKMTESL